MSLEKILEAIRDEDPEKVKEYLLSKFIEPTSPKLREETNNLINNKYKNKEESIIPALQLIAFESFLSENYQTTSNLIKALGKFSILKTETINKVIETIYDEIEKEVGIRDNHGNDYHVKINNLIDNIKDDKTINLLRFYEKDKQELIKPILTIINTIDREETIMNYEIYKAYIDDIKEDIRLFLTVMDYYKEQEPELVLEIMREPIKKDNYKDYLKIAETLINYKEKAPDLVVKSIRKIQQEEKLKPQMQYMLDLMNNYLGEDKKTLEKAINISMEFINTAYDYFMKEQEEEINENKKYLPPYINKILPKTKSKIINKYKIKKAIFMKEFINYLSQEEIKEEIRTKDNNLVEGFSEFLKKNQVINKIEYDKKYKINTQYKINKDKLNHFLKNTTNT